MASFSRCSRLSAVPQCVNDVARVRVLCPALGEGACLASPTVSDGNVRCARGRAFQDPCLGGARPVGAQGGGDKPCRPQLAHVDRPAQ